jgi:Fe-S cluster biogenesis protein NfuA
LSTNATGNLAVLRNSSRQRKAFSAEKPSNSWISGAGRLARPLPLPSKETDMITRERVEMVLERVRPFMQADGGDIELLEVSGNSADVKLTGMCAGCPSAHMTLFLGVETALREEIPEFETLRLL